MPSYASRASWSVFAFLAKSAEWIKLSAADISPKVPATASPATPVKPMAAAAPAVRSVLFQLKPFSSQNILLTKLYVPPFAKAFNFSKVEICPSLRPSLL